MSEIDFIIVGGGAAGCVLANRLTETPNTRVLLIEAGMDTREGATPADILHGYPTSAFNPAYQWPDFLVEVPGSADHHPGYTTRKHYDQGRVMGGGSSINALAANRGAPSDYDEWATNGASGWSWNDVLPYFRKLERDQQAGDLAHGRDGPIDIHRLDRARWTRFTTAIAAAVEDRGFGFEADQNDGRFGDAFFPATLNVRNGQRVSAARGYLTDTVRARFGLMIRPHTRVLRLVFEGRRCAGVEVDRGGEIEILHARKVILAAGALMSPTLLMRSGIGAGEHLSAMGVPVVADRPGVGQNLQDHPGIPVFTLLSPAARLPRAMTQHLQMSLRYSSGMPQTAPGDMYLTVGCRTGWHDIGWRLGMIFGWVNKAYSIGRVRLGSGGSGAYPDVRFNLLSDPRDMERLMRSLRFSIELLAHPQVSALTSNIFSMQYNGLARRLSKPTVSNAWLTGLAGRLLDGPAFVRRATVRRLLANGIDIEAIAHDDSALTAFLRANAIGIKHASGTCRMGYADDPMSVTDTNGQVYGVDDLHVVDASLMPSLPRANTNLPTMMIAEKIADQLRSL